VPITSSTLDEVGASHYGGAGGCARMITPADGIECRLHRASSTGVASRRTSTASGSGLSYVNGNEEAGGEIATARLGLASR